MSRRRFFLGMTKPKEYGVRWSGESSTVCERLGDAVGLVANAHKGSLNAVQNDFDDIYPWSDMKLCNIDTDGNVLAYIGDDTFTRDGSNGDVMVEIPKFYYKRTKTDAVEEWWICGEKLPGYELHPAFTDNGKEVSAVFHSAYNASSYEADGTVKLQSITGVLPLTNKKRSEFRTYARNKGSIWGIPDVTCLSALQMLYLVEYANTNSQSALGPGLAYLTYQSFVKALVETTDGNTIAISSSYKSYFKVGENIQIGSVLGSNSRTVTARKVTAVTTDTEAEQTTFTFDGEPVNISVGDVIWSYPSTNGGSDALNGKSGWESTEYNLPYGHVDVSYRGIEGIFGKVWNFVDGVYIKDGTVYYSNNMADYADGVYDVCTKGVNLISYPYQNTTKTANGVTFTDNGDGSITVDGTAEETAAFSICHITDIDKTKKYILYVGSYSGSGGLVLSLYKDNVWKKEYYSLYEPITVDFLDDDGNLIDFNRIQIAFYLFKGGTASNRTVKPYLAVNTYDKVGYTPGSTNGWITSLGYDENAPWMMLPTAVGGSDSTYIPDYYWASTSGEKVFSYGGMISYTTYCGMFNINHTLTSGSSGNLYGAHLICKKQ